MTQYTTQDEFEAYRAFVKDFESDVQARSMQHGLRLRPDQVATLANKMSRALLHFRNTHTARLFGPPNSQNLDGDFDG